jgi:hypothetical protein
MTPKRIAVQIIIMSLLVLVAGGLFSGSDANAASQAGSDIWHDVTEASIAPIAARATATRNGDSGR